MTEPSSWSSKVTLNERAWSAVTTGNVTPACAPVGTATRTANPRISPRRLPRRRAGRSSISGPLVSSTHRPVDLAAVLPLAKRLALVVELLALGHAELDLDPTVLEVHGERHDRVSRLARLLRELVQLGAVEEQLAAAARRVVGPRALDVLRDVDALEPQLVTAEGGIPVDE